MYDETELDEVVRRIRAVSGKAERTFVVANNHYKGKAVVNAVQLKVRVKGERVNVPSDLVLHYPLLGRYTDNTALFGDR